MINNHFEINNDYYPKLLIAFFIILQLFYYDISFLTKLLYTQFIILSSGFLHI